MMSDTISFEIPYLWTQDMNTQFPPQKSCVIDYLLILPHFSKNKQTIHNTATMSLEDIKADIKALVEEKGCGPILIRLSWHDAGVYSTGKLTGGECIFSCCVTVHVFAYWFESFHVSQRYIIIILSMM